MFRLFCLVCVPTIFILLFLAAAHADIFWTATRRHRNADGFSVFLMFLWIPALLVPAVYVANLISGERSDQTLDVLLTSPLEPRDILRQKMAAVPRVVGLVALPLVITVLIEFWGEYACRRMLGEGIIYLVLALGSIFIYEHLVVWIAMRSSLRTRRRSAVEQVVPRQPLEAGQQHQPGFVHGHLWKQEIERHAECERDRQQQAARVPHRGE